MRSAQYLEWLVSTYRRALDRLIADPDNYSTNAKEMEILYENRIRNYTIGNIIKPLDWTVIDFQGTGNQSKVRWRFCPGLKLGNHHKQ